MVSWRQILSNIVKYSLWQKYHFQNNFGLWKIKQPKVVFRPIEIRISVWNLTIHDGNKFQSNEVNGSYFPGSCSNTPNFSSN